MYPAFNSHSRPPGTGINAPLDDQGRTALHLAVAQNDEVALLRLLRIGANPNQQDKNGQTPLFHAVSHDRPGMIALLAARGGQTNLRDDKGRGLIDWAVEEGAAPGMLDVLRDAGARLEPHPRSKRTALHLAAQHGRTDMIEPLIQAGQSVNARDSDGKTPLHLAVAGGHLAAAQGLIAQGAQPNARDNDIETPLFLAARAGDAAMTDFLLSLPAVRAEVNSHAAYRTGFTPLLAAASENHPAIIEKLIAVGADANQTDNQNRNSLFIAAEKGHLEAARKLLALGADARKSPVSNNNRSPLLHWVNESGYREMLALLLGAGADINALDGSGQTALHRACDMTQGEKIKALLSFGADPNIVNAFGQRPIDELMDNYAYRNNEVADIMGALLAKGADPDISPAPEMEEGPLHLAAQYGHRETVRMLLAHNAQVDAPARSHARKTPLLIAVEHGHLAIAEMLVQKGANPLKTDAQRRNALHLAASQGDTALLRFVLGLPGVDINAQDVHGRTALHYACMREKPEAVQQLLGAGADDTIFDDDGLTALHRGVASASTGVLPVFEQARPDPAIWDSRTRENGDTLLHLAVRRGLEAPLEKLLALGADVTRGDYAGRSALHLSIQEEKTALTALLLNALKQRGISIDALRDKMGATPLHAAAAKNNTFAAAQMIDAGADVIAADENGDTALHLAARAGHLDVAEYLALKQGASVLLPNKQGETPLHLALQGKHEKVFTLLLPLAMQEQEAQTAPAKTRKPRPPRPNGG